MIAFAVRRLLLSVPIVVLASMLVFAMVARSGDPLALLRQNPRIPAEVLEQRARDLNLDKPVYQRYLIWAGDFVRGDMGESITGLDIEAELFRRMVVTLRLVVIALALAVAVAVFTGVLSAVRQYSGVDYTFTALAFLFLSTPIFWLAALLKEFAAIRLNNLLGGTYVFTVGYRTPNFEGSLMETLGDYAGHMLLPVLALALIEIAVYTRYQRAAMLDVLNSEYIRLARAKGLGRAQVLVKHALRNALIPITTLVAIQFAGLIGGAVITERVFAWHGMGEMLVEGVINKDVNVVAAWMMVTSIVVVVFNIVADILYAVLDPRIRYG